MLSRCLCLAVCAAFACSSSSTPPSAATLNGFYDSYTAALAAAKYGCRYGVSAQAGLFDYRGPAEVYAREQAALVAGVQAGRLAYDADKAQSCLAALGALGTCWGPAGSLPRVPETGPADCLAALHGTVGAGGTCYADECSSGFCDTGSTGASCPGTCSTAGAAGAACALDGDCVEGLQCAPAAGGGGSVCSPPGSAGAACADDGDCAAGLVCAPTSVSSGMATCSAPLAAGAACVVGSAAQNLDPCAAGYWCAPAGGSQTQGTCAAQVAAGGDCSEAGQAGLRATQCAGVQMCIGQSGQTPGKCATPQDVGGPCAAADDLGQTGCLGGLVCDASTHLCAAAPGPGAACAGGTLCDTATAYCDANGACQALLADGASCPSVGGQESPCLSGFCHDPTGSGQGTCVLQLPYCAEP